jgi:hypothetical protein
MREINAYKVLVEKHKGNRPLGRPRRRQESEIKTYPKKYDVRVWTGSILLRIGTGVGLL